MKIMDVVRDFEGKSNSERRSLVKRYLSKNKIKFIGEQFSVFGVPRENIIVELGKGKDEIILSAHYDKVLGSPGANDNASGVACLLYIADKLRKRRSKNRLKVIFFDAEEGIPPFTYCIGSEKYVEKHGTSNLIGAYNLEMVGNGDMIGIWSVLDKDTDDPVLKTLISAIKKGKLRYDTGSSKSIFASDHLSFRRAGFRSAYSLTALRSEEKNKIKQFIAHSPFESIMIYLFEGRKLPSLLRTYHNRHDKSSLLSEKTLKNVADVVFEAALRLDKTA